MENPAATLPQTQSTVVRGERGLGRTEQGLCSAGEELEGKWRGGHLPLQHMLPSHSYSVGRVSGFDAK